MNKNFKLGIITMQRVRNNGSALQAFALQTKVNELGFDSELIDYVFPNKSHFKIKKNILIRYARQIKHFIEEVLFGFPSYKQLKRLNQFYQNHYLLSARTYLSKAELDNNPPLYDLLITGSDQVWNPKHVGEDTTFMFSFCNDDSIPRISYASSFTTSQIPEKLRPLYAKYLSKYKVISVRESSGIKIINDLINKKAEIVCDPTLLLNKFEWSKIASSKIKIKKPYILVYVLTYAYNPYPKIDRIIKKLLDQLGLHVVFLNGKITDYKYSNSTVIRNAGPCEFVKLFMDAQYVITTSLHGTAFALNFSVPFYSVVNNLADDDSRMLNLLHSVGAEKRAISIDTLDINAEPVDYSIIKSNIQKLRNTSIDYLFNSIQDNLK